MHGSLLWCLAVKKIPFFYGKENVFCFVLHEIFLLKLKNDHLGQFICFLTGNIVIQMHFVSVWNYTSNSVIHQAESSSAFCKGHAVLNAHSVHLAKKGHSLKRGLGFSFKFQRECFQGLFQNALWLGLYRVQISVCQTLPCIFHP